MTRTIQIGLGRNRYFWGWFGCIWVTVVWFRGFLVKPWRQRVYCFKILSPVWSRQETILITDSFQLRRRAYRLNKFETHEIKSFDENLILSHLTVGTDPFTIGKIIRFGERKSAKVIGWVVDWEIGWLSAELKPSFVGYIFIITSLVSFYALEISWMLIW